MKRVAVQFRVGIATAIAWVSRARQSGERGARRQGHPHHSKLDPYRDFLLGLIEATSDITIVEMQERLAAERGIKASVGTIWTFLDRCGLTRLGHRILLSSGLDGDFRESPSRVALPRQRLQAALVKLAP